MGLMSGLSSAIGSVTGGMFYDSLKANENRRPLPPARVRHGDRKMRDADRRQLQAKLHELGDNFALAAWMIRQHVNHIASLNFKADTGRDSVDRRLDEFMEWWSSRLNCHAQRRHCLGRLIRLIETLRVTQGDVFILKIAGSTPLRGSIQIIEPDRVADPPDAKEREIGGDTRDRRDRSPWYGGVKVTANGIPSEYAIHARTPEGDIVHERNVRAESIVHHGNFTRADEYRGVSPLQLAANQLGDIYESFEYLNRKLKVASALAAVITRDADMGLGAEPQTDGDGDGINDRDYEWDLSSGPKIFDLMPGEGVQTIQGSADSMDAVNLLRMMTQVALKSLDLPMSFFSEDFSNWFGQRASGIHFEKAAKPKRAELIETMNDVTRWRIGMAIFDGDIELPKTMQFEDLRWQWVPEATGWFDPLKEAQGYRALISAGLDSPIDICKANGRDWEQVLADRKLFEERAAELGVTLDFAMGSSSSSAVSQPNEEEEPEEEVADDQEQEETEEPEDDSEDGSEDDQ